MARLPSLDWSDDGTVLDWLCAFQPASDHVGVVSPRESMVRMFEANGLRANVNTGAAYRADDRENSFRYLVGETCDGVKSGPAIHPILLKFAAE